MARILLRGGLLITMNRRREVGTGDVLIERGVVAGVGERPQGRRRVDEIVDARGRIVLPGFVQAHTHLCQTLARGRADGRALLEWLRDRIWPYEAALTARELRAAARLGAAEAALAGTTAVLDMAAVRHTDEVFRACEEIGLRATIGKAMMDARDRAIPEALREETRASIDESLALAARWHGAAGGRLRYAFAPRFVLSSTTELLERVAALGRARRLRVHTHASENRDECRAVRRRLGRDNVAALHALGVSGPHVVLAHCVWATDEELALLARTGTHVAHCPSSNLKLGSGVARVPEMRERGVNVALGADGAPCNNNLDPFVEMRLAALVQAPRLGPAALAPHEVVEMATLGGARALGIERRVGRLERGRRADVVVVDARRLHAAPAGDPYSTLVHAARGSDVEHVLVDGRFVVRRGRLATMSERQLARDAAHARAALDRRLGLDP